MSGLWRKVFIDGQPVIDSPTVLQQLGAVLPSWVDGLDVITCPVGKDPGKARFMVDSESFADIQRSQPVSIRLQTGNTKQPGDEQDFTFKNWIVTGYFDALPVKGTRPIVVTLADPRHVFRNSAYAKQYNIRYPLGSRYEPDSLNSGNPWTWEEIFDDLWNAVPTQGLITTFTKNNLPTTTPENIDVLGEPAWDAICRLAHQQGLEIYYDPFTATITIDKVDGAMVTVQPERRLAQSGDDAPSGLEQAYAPENVRVFFAKRAEPEDGNHLPHQIDVAGGGGKGDAVAWSNLTAETDDTGAVIDAQRLQDEADQIAGEYVKRRANNAKSQSIRYLGWDDVKPEPGTTEVHWIAQPFAQTLVMLRPTDPPIVKPHIGQRGQTILFKLTEDFAPRTNLVPTSKVCDVFGLDLDTSELVEENWSDDSVVQRKIWYAGDSTISATTDEPKYLLAKLDYGGNYWVDPIASGGGSQIQGPITAVRNAGTGDDLPYTGKKIATMTVEVAPCNRASLIGTSVEVVDHSGCVLDLTNEELIGLWMFASEGIAESNEGGVDPGTLTPCHWVADDRCCP